MGDKKKVSKIRDIEWKIKYAINRVIFNLSWKNRNRIDKFRLFLRDKCRITFDVLEPCFILGRHEYREAEYDGDRYYDMLELYVRNIFTGKKYYLTDFLK